MGTLVGGINACGKLDVFEQWVRAITKLDMIKLLDGGILNPVPIAPTFEDGNDLTVAINLGAPPSGRPNPAPELVPKDKGDSQTDSVHERINGFIEGLKNRSPTSKAGSWKMLNIADQTIDAMQSTTAPERKAVICLV